MQPISPIGAPTFYSSLAPTPRAAPLEQQPPTDIYYEEEQQISAQLPQMFLPQTSYNLSAIATNLTNLVLLPPFQGLMTPYLMYSTRNLLFFRASTIKTYPSATNSPTSIRGFNSDISDNSELDLQGYEDFVEDYEDYNEYVDELYEAIPEEDTYELPEE